MDAVGASEAEVFGGIFVNHWIDLYDGSFDPLRPQWALRAMFCSVCTEVERVQRRRNVAFNLRRGGNRQGKDKVCF